MDVFESTYIVVKDDLDALNHVNNVRYLQWVQDIAEAHWNKNTNTAIKASYFWVVLSHHIEYKSAAKLNDTLLLKTFVTQSQGVTSTRVVEMYHTNNNTLIAKAETKWCLMSSATKRPARITEEISNLFD